MKSNTISQKEVRLFAEISTGYWTGCESLDDVVASFNKNSGCNIVQYDGMGKDICEAHDISDDYDTATLSAFEFILNKSNT